MKGILDRFEDNNNAIILIEELDEEIIIPVGELPEGSKVNTFFKMEKQCGRLQIVSIDDTTTKHEGQKTSDLMAKLRAKNKGSKFKRN